VSQSQALCKFVTPDLIGCPCLFQRLYPHARVWQLGMTNTHKTPALRESPEKVTPVTI
jgi:hypothetical protein